MDDMTFGDTAAAAWGAQLINNALRELPGGRSQVEMNLLIEMCRAEPKNAQMTLQLLADALKTQLDGAPVSQASGTGQTLRLLIGSTFLAYSVSREMTDQVPPELEFIVGRYPIIMQCADFVVGDQERLIAGPLPRTNRRWWMFWRKR
jgi:hypothetical protein